MMTTRLKSKSVAEGYLAGGAALILTICWMLYSPFHALVIFALFLVALFCLSLSTLWLLSQERTIKGWFKAQPLRYVIVVFVELILIAVFFLTLFYLR